MKSHLETAHLNLVRSGNAVDAIEQMRLGNDAHNRYWCGFCNDIIPQNIAEMQSAAEARFKHIGDHYDKDERDFRDWICVEKNQTKGELSAVAKRKAQYRQGTARTDDEESFAEDALRSPLRPRHTELGSSAMASRDADMVGHSALATSNHKRRRLSHPDDDAEFVPDDDDSMQM